MQGPPCLLLDLAALLLCYEYLVQVFFASGLSAMVVVGCVHSRVSLIAPLLCYEYPVQGLFCLWYNCMTKHSLIIISVPNHYALTNNHFCT